MEGGGTLSSPQCYNEIKKPSVYKVKQLPLESDTVEKIIVGIT